MSEIIKATGPLYIAPAGAPDFMSHNELSIDPLEPVGFGPAVETTRQLIVKFTFAFKDFAQQVSATFGKLTELFLSMGRAGIVSHKSPHLRKVKAIDRVNAVREKRLNGRGPGFVKRTTPQASAMHAAYRRKKR